MFAKDRCDRYVRNRRSWSFKTKCVPKPELGNERITRERNPPDSLKPLRLDAFRAKGYQRVCYCLQGSGADNPKTGNECLPFRAVVVPIGNLNVNR